MYCIGKINCVYGKESCVAVAFVLSADSGQKTLVFCNINMVSSMFSSERYDHMISHSCLYFLF